MDDPVTYSDLKHVFLSASGVEGAVALSPAALDTSFENLGYDSVALLEVGSIVERTYSVALADEELATSQTPRELLSSINAQCTAEA